MRYRHLSFLTDFGLADEFVGVVRSVMLGIAPELIITDITHDIAPYDVRGGGLALARSAPYLNAGVVVAVVDPGVGSERRAVAVEVGDGMSVLVGPDNGLLAPAVALVGGATRAIDISNSPVRLEPNGATFDGRDLFGPVGAHLCAGVPFEELGEPLDPGLLTPAIVPVSAVEGDTIVAEVLWVDRFGNAQLNVDPSEVDGLNWSVQVGEEHRPARRATHFDDLQSAEFGLMVDSNGMVALVLNRASAARELRLGPGIEVRLTPGAGGTTTPVALTKGPR